MFTRRLPYFAMCAGLLGLLLAAAAFRPAAIRYTVQPAASRLVWVGHAEVGSYAPSGTVPLSHGSFEYDGTTLRNGRFVVNLASLHHDNAQLQQHLRGAEFFDVARFPTAEFRLQTGLPAQVRGLLSIKGVRRPVSFPLTVTPIAGGLRLRGTVSLDRTQFGIRYRSTRFFADLGDQAIRNDFQLLFDVMATARPK
ncbi:YceI family protein [Hymenobacter coalescens]